jgi:hypothetical protein
MATQFFNYKALKHVQQQSAGAFDSTPTRLLSLFPRIVPKLHPEKLGMTAELRYIHGIHHH